MATPKFDLDSIPTINPGDLDGIPTISTTDLNNIPTEEAAPTQNGLVSWLSNVNNSVKNTIADKTSGFADWLINNVPGVARGIQGVGSAVSDYSKQPLLENNVSPIDPLSKIMARMTDPSVAPEVAGYGFPAIMTAGGSIPLQIAGGVMSALGGSAGRLTENAMGFDRFRPEAEPGRVLADTALNTVATGAGAIAKKVAPWFKKTANQIDMQNEGFTPQVVERSINQGGDVSAAGFEPDILKSREIVKADGGLPRGVTPQEAAASAWKPGGRVDQLDSQLGGLIAEADKARKGPVMPDLTNAEAYVESLPVGTTDREVAESYLNAMKDKYFGKSIPNQPTTVTAHLLPGNAPAPTVVPPALDGSIAALQTEKRAIYKQLSDRAFSRAETAVDPIRDAVEKAVASDLKRTIEVATGSPQVKGLNDIMGAYADILPVVKKGAAKQIATPATEAARNFMMGKGAKMAAAPLVGAGVGAGYEAYQGHSPIKGAIAGGLAGMLAKGAMGAGGMDAMGSAANIISKGPGPGAAGLVRTMSPSISSAQADILPPQQDPFANGLPRDTSQWNMMAVNRFAQYALSKPPEVAGIAQGLVQKFADALHQENKGKMQKIVADMAKLFPDAFQPGMGIDNKIFHPDDQSEYMNILMGAMRRGQVSPSFVAQQRDSFLDSNDNSILPVHPEVAKQIPNLQTNKPPVNGQPRQYGY